jgi:hypothetical protein
MLHIITQLNDPLLDLVKDDPVRPEIPIAARVNTHAEVFVLYVEDAVAAVTCVSYCAGVPAAVSDLELNDVATTAVFYTIWSYKPGGGRRLIQAAQEHIRSNRANILRWVTLSPKSDMARRFHLNNGASIYRENTDTINYEYC